MFALLCIGVNSFAAGDLTVTGNATVNGNMGVGVTTPTYKLDVAGQIHATQGTPIYQVPLPPSDCGSIRSTYIFLNGSCTINVQPGTFVPSSQLYYLGGVSQTICYPCTSGNANLVGRLIAP